MKHLASKPPGKSGPIVPSLPPMDPALQRQKLSLLAWLRVGFGAAAGLIAGLLNFLTLQPPTVNPNAYNGIIIGFLIYFGSFYFAKYNLVKGINPKDKNKLITQGIGSYIIMFIFSWIMFNTYHTCAVFNVCHL
jgi:hypothetical protein